MEHDSLKRLCLWSSSSVRGASRFALGSPLSSALQELTLNSAKLVWLLPLVKASSISGSPRVIFAGIPVYNASLSQQIFLVLHTFHCLSQHTNQFQLNQYIAAMIQLAVLKYTKNLDKREFKLYHVYGDGAFKKRGLRKLLSEVGRRRSKQFLGLSSLRSESYFNSSGQEFLCRSFGLG